MRKLLLVLLVLLLLASGAAGLGSYRGWISFETGRDPETGQQGIRLELDEDKIKPDIEKVKSKMSGATQGGEKTEGQER